MSEAKTAGPVLQCGSHWPDKLSEKIAIRRLEILRKCKQSRRAPEAANLKINVFFKFWEQSEFFGKGWLQVERTA